MSRRRFSGAIAGVGSSSGVRVVVGRWEDSPFGTFADVMLAEPDGTRVLLAPDEQVADFVSSTYRFDRVEIGPVVATSDWSVTAPGLALRLGTGPRTPLGRLLRLVPARLATSPTWTRATDPVARAVLSGVRTRGTAGNGRREFYGATDVHRITSLTGSWQGADLGSLAPVSPEPGFGFGSTPRTPSVTTIVTTVEATSA
ncbi:hypothetical protein [Marmoricola sp. URHB0036]|uniref:hypothetical protein n=1 Tax=Marmoricola sp. URHB0036 TaxID=1298863 RepID=UPI000414393B|nr:hypothetical protein [Marmoricola sp. URHB0036]